MPIKFLVLAGGVWILWKGGFCGSATLLFMGAEIFLLVGISAPIKNI